MQKNIEVCGVGNALVDITVDISERELALLGYPKSTMVLVDAREQKGLLEQFADREGSLCSGGSVANSMIGFSQLGGKAGFICCVGDDRYGLFYKNEFDTLGIQIGNPVVHGGFTGTCVALITPDAERTMRTHLGINSKIAPKHIDAGLIGASQWLFLEGYQLANPGEGQAFVREAVACARRSQTKIALTFSEGFVVEQFRDFVVEIVRQCDLVFANQREAETYTGQPALQASFEALAGQVPSVVVTASEKGALISHDGVRCKVDGFPCIPIDVTGAGDMFAGSFLYGITHGYAPDVAGRGACRLAMAVITQRGARLARGVKEIWKEVT